MERAASGTARGEGDHRLRVELDRAGRVGERGLPVGRLDLVHERPLEPRAREAGVELDRAGRVGEAAFDVARVAADPRARGQGPGAVGSQLEGAIELLARHLLLVLEPLEGDSPPPFALGAAETARKHERRRDRETEHADPDDERGRPEAARGRWRRRVAAVLGRVSSLERARERLAVGEAVLGLVGERAADDPGEPPRHVGARAPQRDDVVTLDLGDDLVRALALEGGAPREALVDHAAEGEDVGRGRRARGGP